MRVLRTYKVGPSLLIMLRRKRKHLRLNTNDISGPITLQDAPDVSNSSVSQMNSSSARGISNKIPTSSLPQIIEQRTWENEQLRQELLHQQRKHAIGMYLLEEVKLAVESLQKALDHFERCNVEIESET